MLGRDDALAMIQEAYRARVSGDKERLGRYWAEGAHFEVVGDKTLLPNVSLTAATPMQAISDLIDQFTMSDLQLVDAVVERNKLAIRWRVTITTAGQAPSTTQMLDLIELDEEGKIRSFVQFTDTALVRHLAG